MKFSLSIYIRKVLKCFIKPFLMNGCNLKATAKETGDDGNVFEENATNLIDSKKIK